MRTLRITRDAFGSIGRAILLAAAASTYLVSTDDVVWHFIKASPHPRIWEHVAFGTAAAMLGIALLLKLQAGSDAGGEGAYDPDRTRAGTSNLLRALGIGSLLPLPGFLLLVLGDLGITLFLPGRRAIPKESKDEPDLSHLSHPPWASALTTHIGLCCAFLSMLLFSVLLIDRAADALFGATALISVAAGFWRTLRLENRSWLQRCFARR